MDYADDKGVTNRKRLQQVWETTGEKPPELVDIEIPVAGMDLFSSFWEIRGSKSIDWERLYYYGKYTGLYFTFEEIRILFAMNNVADKWIADKERARTNINNKSKKPVNNPSIRHRPYHR